MAENCHPPNRHIKPIQQAHRLAMTETTGYSNLYLVRLDRPFGRSSDKKWTSWEEATLYRGC